MIRFPLLLTCGWQLSTVTPPCVAQRVCAIPRDGLFFGAWFATSCASALTLPVLFRTDAVHASSSTAIPAESYPRYSRRSSPFNKICVVFFGQIYQKIQHMGINEELKMKNEKFYVKVTKFFKSVMRLSRNQKKMQTRIVDSNVFIYIVCLFS